MPLTARAIIVLEEIAKDPRHGAAEGLSKKIGIGRDSIQKAITELRKAGLVETKTYKTGARSFGKSLRLTEAGYHALTARASILLYGLNPNSNLILDINTDLLDYKQNGNAQVKEGNLDYEDTPMYIDPEDLPEFRRRARERKHKEKMDFHAKRDKERMKRRDELKPEDWTVTDATFEFGYQMKLLWHVAPWEVTRSAFRYALNDKRDEYNTDGAIEQKMMKIFFDKIKHDTRINDPEKIWRRFIQEFPSLLVQVNRESVTPEQLEEERQRSQKSRSVLRVQKN